MSMDKISINEQFSLLKEEWAPKIIAESNGQSVRILKGTGELGWHKHENEEKIIMVFKGQLTLKLKESNDITLETGEMYVMPKGVDHCPVAQADTHFMMIEPS
ncbi:cupin domain-containing protein [Marinomonas foliarum]|uniref:Cupin domain n=1 Tax=Marinomonas foliarum TaxID=491950 RepID=A0A369AD05_9GAMM|nr:cupin domain-containing protein [Marinomonas foliarum]RCX07242.1 cupin domain [Marinomonas foliarum]